MMMVERKNFFHFNFLENNIRENHKYVSHIRMRVPDSDEVLAGRSLLIRVFYKTATQTFYYTSIIDYRKFIIH